MGCSPLSAAAVPKAFFFACSVTLTPVHDARKRFTCPDTQTSRGPGWARPSACLFLFLTTAVLLISPRLDFPMRDGACLLLAFCSHSDLSILILLHILPHTSTLSVCEEGARRPALSVAGEEAGSEVIPIGVGRRFSIFLSLCLYRMEEGRDGQGRTGGFWVVHVAFLFLLVLSILDLPI